MSKHRDVPLVGRGWRALCSAVPLLLILATMIVVPPIAIAQEAPSTGATGASGATGAVGATGATGGTPTITSDKADYQPGALVTLTGVGWADGENVHIVVNDTIGQTWKYQSDVVASDGSFTNSFNLPNYFVSDYDVTATGPISGTATTTFTDAPLKITGKDHEGQSSTGGYTSGNTNTYKEGDFINFRFTITSNDATTGTDPSSGRVEVRFTGDDGSCLFFDGSFALGAINIPSTAGDDTAAPVLTVSGITPTVTLVGVPVAQDFGTSGGEWVQKLQIDFSDAGQAVVNYHLRLSAEAGQCNGASQHSRLAEPTDLGDFTQTGAQNVPVPANQVIELPEITVIKQIDRDGNGSFEDLADAGEYKFCLDGSAVNCLPTDANGQAVFVNVTPDGAHTVTEQQLVFTNGTYAFISGTGTNCTFSGSTGTATIASGSTPTNATCIFQNGLQTASLDVEKTTVGGTGSFNFVNSGTGLSNFSRDTGVTNPTTNAPITFVGGQFGDKFVQETVPAGWTLTNIQCTANGATVVIGTGTGGTFAAGTTTGFDTGDTTVKVTIGAGNTPSCVFTNTKGASLDVEKTTVGGTGSFSFVNSGDGLSNFSRDTGVTNPTTNAPIDFTSAQFGDKFVQETVPAGWTLTNIQCTANGATVVIGTGTGGTFAAGTTTGFDTGDTTVKVTIGAGNTPSCVFTNTKGASLDVEKTTVGGTGSFSFVNSGDGLSNFSRDTGVTNPTTNAPIDFTSAQFGDKFVQETVPAGWTLTNIQCTANGATVVIGTGTGGTFAAGTTTGFDTGDTTVKVTIGAGNTPSCVFTNTKGASLDVEKTTVGGAGDFSFTATGSGLDNFSRNTDPNNPTTSDPFAFTGLQLGDKFVTEDGETGFTLTNITCTPGGAEIVIGRFVAGVFSNGGTDGFDPGDTTVKATITAGDTPSCTFENTKGASLDIEKTTIGGAGDFSFTATGSGLDNFSRNTDPNNPTTSDPFAFTGLQLGDKFVTEDGETGFTLTNITCTPGGAEIVIGRFVAGVFSNGGTDGFDPGDTTVKATITAGDTPSCTFENTKGASLDIEKTTIGGAGDFSFTATGSGLDNFSRNTDPNNPTTSDPFAFTGLQLGDKFVTEDGETGFTLTNITCTPGGAEIVIGRFVAGVFSNGGTDGFDPGDTTVKATITAGDTPSCTFENTKGASLDIEKTTIGGAGDFSFTATGSGLDNFSRNTDPNNPTTSDPFAFTGLQLGDKFVTEDGETGFTLTNITCTPGGAEIVIGRFVAGVFSNGGTDGFDPGDTTVKATITAGDTPSCTFENTKGASLDIEKTTIGGAGDFSFTATGSGLDNFSRNTDPNNPTTSDPFAFTGLQLGDKFVTEDGETGFTLTNITCTPGGAEIVIGRFVAGVFSNGGTDGFDPGDTTVKATITAGDTPSCTFENTKGASLDIEKTTIGGAGDFSFTATGSGLDNFSRNTDPNNPTTSDPFAFTGLQLGDKFVTEDGETGFTLTNITCTPGGAEIVIGRFVAGVFSNGGTDGFDPGDTTVKATITAGDTPSCTFENTKGASLDIEKTTIGGAGDFSFTATGSGLDNFSRNTDPNNPTTSDPFAFTGLQLGDKFVTEDGETGFTLTNITCTPGGAEIVIGRFVAGVFSNGGTDGFDPGDTTVKATITAGDTPSCTFENTKGASLDIEKTTIGGAGDFSFTATGSGLDNFSRNTDPNNPTTSDPFAFTGLQLGDKFVTEDGETGFTLTNITCTPGGAEIVIGRFVAGVFSNGGTDGFDPGDTTVKATITAGDTPSCTFENTKGASLDIEKTTIGGAGDFSFTATGSGLDNFSRNTDPNNPTTSDPFAFTGLQLGDKFVTEDGETGFTLTNITCTPGGAEIVIGRFVAGVFSNGGTDGFDPGDTTVKATITAGDTPSCTFENTKGASLDIEKTTIGGAGDFSFTATGSGLDNFSRNTDPNNPTTSDPFAFTGLQLGDKFVTEDGETGFTLTNITCTPGGAEIVIGRFVAGVFSNGGTDGFDPGDTTVKATITAGDTPSCTFENTKGASLDIEKTTIGGAGDFSFTATGSGLDNFSRNTDPNNPTTSDPFAFTGLQLGDKFVTEDGETGFTLTNITCTPGGAEIVIGRFVAGVFSNGGTDGFDPGDTTVKATITAGDTPSCTFENTKGASLDIEKKTVGGTASFGYTVSGSGLASFSRTTATNNPSQNDPFPFTGLELGDKYVKETLLAGWTLSNITCTLGGAEIVIGTGINGTFAAGATNGFDPGDTSVKVTITAGDTPSCEFENTKNASLDIEKQTSGGTGTFSYTVSGSGLVDFTRNTAVTNPTQNTPFPFTGAQLGDKYVKETLLAGWTLSNITCTLGGAEIVIGTGINGTFAAGATNGFDPGDTTVKVTITAGDTPSCVFTNTRIVVHPGTIGFWKNWRNHYTPAQIQTVINKIKTDNPLVYNKAGFPLTVAVYDAIFNYGTGTPRDQQVLGQLTALKSNLAITILDPNPVQKNDDICRTGVVNVSGISGATAYFGTATPTVGQVVDAIESKWNGNLTTNRSNWSFNLTNTQKTMFIEILTGMNEGTILNSAC